MEFETAAECGEGIVTTQFRNISERGIGVHQELDCPVHPVVDLVVADAQSSQFPESSAQVTG